MNGFLFVRGIPKCFNSSTLSKDLFPVFMLWFRPAYWSQDIIIYFFYHQLRPDQSP